MKTIIFHVDVNSAYLSWEAAYRLLHLGAAEDLRKIPSIIGGSTDTRSGIVLAKSIPAKKYGIKTGEVVWQAKQKCPKLYVAPPNYSLYNTCSKALLQLLAEYTPCVEQYSIDEAYMDMTGTEKLWGNPVQAALLVRDRIFRELGFTVNIGISTNKLLAKMASDFEKPNLVHTLFPEEIQRKLWGLPVSDLFFVGRAANKKLLSLGIRTIGDLAKTDVNLLAGHLKKHGEVIWAFANGIDTSFVVPEPPANKGYGNSMTIPFDVCDSRTARQVLLSLCETVAARLRSDGAQAQTVSVERKDIDFLSKSHQASLSVPTNCTLEIYHKAVSLFEELWDKKPIRHLGVHAGRITPEAFWQYRMFDSADYHKFRIQDAAIDSIRNKFGADSVKRAVFLNSDIHHMNGGILNKI